MEATRGKIEYFCKYKGQAMPQEVFLEVDTISGEVSIDYDPDNAYRSGMDNTQDEPYFSFDSYIFTFKAVPHPDFAEYVIKSVKDNYLKYLQDPKEAEFTAKVVLALVNDMDEYEDFLTWSSADDYFSNKVDYFYDDVIRPIIWEGKTYLEIITWIDDDCYNDGKGVYIYDLEDWLDKRIEFLKSGLSDKKGFVHKEW